MAVVEMVGCLIRELAVSADLTTDTAQTQKQLTGLYDLLLERMLDVSSYVRTKVLAVFVKLCDVPVKFPKQRLAMTRAATAALHDKAASVRKGSLLLLETLVGTHPYGLMHGGLLGLAEWEERYRNVKAELEKVEGRMGNAVEREEGEEPGEQDGSEEESEADEEEVDGDESPKKKRKKCVSREIKTPRRLTIMSGRA
jgi:condensin complex subunit 1